MGTKLQVITLKQLPIIEEHLQLVKADVETRTKNAMQLVCTEETRGDVKKIRTELGKEFASMEEQRKRVKEAIMEPYNQFEAVYKDCISDPYKKADSELTSMTPRRAFTRSIATMPHTRLSRFQTAQILRCGMNRRSDGWSLNSLTLCRIIHRSVHCSAALI